MSVATSADGDESEVDEEDGSDDDDDDSVVEESPQDEPQVETAPDEDDSDDDESVGLSGPSRVPTKKFEGSMTGKYHGFSGLQVMGAHHMEVIE